MIFLFYILYFNYNSVIKYSLMEEYNLICLTKWGVKIHLLVFKTYRGGEIIIIITDFTFINVDETRDVNLSFIL